MGIISKQSIINLFTSYTGVVIGAINTLLLFPNIFSAQEFGLTRIIVNAAMFGTSLFSFGINNLTLKFFPTYKNDTNNHNGFLSFIMIIPFIGYLIFIVLSLVFRNEVINFYQKDSDLFSDNYFYVILLVFYLIYLHLFDSYLRALNKSVLYTILDDIVLKCLWTTLILLYYFKYINFNQFVFGYVNAYGLILLIEICYLIYIKQFKVWSSLKNFNLSTTKKMISFGLITMFGTGISGAALTIDSLIIGSIDKNGLAGVAFYSIAFYISFLIFIPFNSLNRISNTSISEAWNNNNIDLIDKLYKKSCNNLLIIGVLIFIGIWSNVDSLFHFLPSEYKEAKYVLFFICIAKLFEVSIGTNAIIVHYSKYYKVIFYVNILLISLLISTDYLLIPKMGIVGAALATLLSTIVIISIYTIFLYRKYNILPFTFKSIFTLVIGLMVYLIINLIPEIPNVYLSIFTKSTLISLLFLSAVYFLKISDDINRIIDTTIKRIGLK